MYLEENVRVSPCILSKSNHNVLLAIILFGVTSLLIGSAGSGWATSMPMFLVARCFAGLGAGGLGGMAFIVIADLVELGMFYAVPFLA